MIGLPERLDAIEGINHTIYADDITIWTTESMSSGSMQDRLQRAVREVEKHLEGTGLVCAPNKSEILLHRPRKPGRPPRDVADARQTGVRVTTKEGGRIPTVSKIRVLGLWLEENGANSELVTRLQKKVAAATNLIRRVTNRRKGMREHNVVRLIQAYALSHITYVAAYVNWSNSEINKLDTIIRRAYKTALGVPHYTANCRLFELGVHNTLAEIIEAQRTAQLERLSGTRTGRTILDSLGIRYHGMRGLKDALLPAVRNAILTENIPRNMHPVHDAERRRCRAEAILKDHGRREGVLFVDAARYPRPYRRQQQNEREQQRRQSTPAFSMAVVDTSERTVVTGSARLPSSEAAEEMAIALAILHSGNEDTLVVSDAKTAVRNFAKGWVSVEAAHMLNARVADFKSNAITTKSLKWFPAHVGELGNEQRPDLPSNHNERAHRVARLLTRRDADERATAVRDIVDGESPKDILVRR